MTNEERAHDLAIALLSSTLRKLDLDSFTSTLNDFLKEDVKDDDLDLVPFYQHAYATFLDQLNAND